jgi:capsular polysaccharide export protein
MISQGIQAFANKRVLLLQGPVGPFFSRLSRDLEAFGAQVYKVNFNAGDWLFYPLKAINYRGSIEDWPEFFKPLIERLNIDVIFLFGDCRPIHKAAHSIALERGLEIGVFEEGYVRPDYVTLERYGVNGYSQLARDPEYYVSENIDIPQRLPVENAYWTMVWYGFLYYAIGSLGKPCFRHYIHHRPLTLLEALPWIRSVWRKYLYRWNERGVIDILTRQWNKKYYLVPLQVFNDTQICEHTDLESVEHFIETTLHSYAKHAPADTLLVFKHHPMDRGYKDYTALITELAREHGISSRIRYIHDQHLPTLLSKARGVVVVNSTVGLSSLHHCIPTKVCGNALYDLSGLTYQGTLDDFWHATHEATPDFYLYLRFISNLINKSQMNGSFYKRLKVVNASTGLLWIDIHKWAHFQKNRTSIDVRNGKVLFEN